MGNVKTTVEISDRLLARANRHARKSGRSLSALIEEGLRQVLDTPVPRIRYRLTDVSAGNPSGTDPLEAYSWQEMRAMIYGHPGKR